MTWKGGNVSNLKVKTGRSGVANFKVTSVTPSWKFCVTGLTKAGYVYDFSANEETSDHRWADRQAARERDGWEL